MGTRVPRKTGVPLMTSRFTSMTEQQADVMTIPPAESTPPSRERPTRPEGPPNAVRAGSGESATSLRIVVRGKVSLDAPVPVRPGAEHSLRPRPLHVAEDRPTEERWIVPRI